MTQYAYPSAKTRGAKAADSLLRVTTSFEYDFNTGLPLSATDANGNKTVNVYDPASWRVKETVQPTNARTIYDYDDAALKVTETTLTAAGGAVAGKTIKHLNGLGQVTRQTIQNDAGSSDLVDTKYDVMGRVIEQTRPYRGTGPQYWVETVYDATGRVIESKQPYNGPAASEATDRSVSRSFYNEATRPQGASSESGQTVRAVDAWGHWRWARLDASGRLVEVVEESPDGGSGLVTRYTYDALGNLVGVQQGAQSRRFRYDAVGRLTHQKLAETEAKLNAAGEIATNESENERWGDVFKYDERSNLVWHTDARGVRTKYEYGSDPLNRLQEIIYDTSRVNTTQLTVAPAPNVRFGYRTKTAASQARDVTQVESVTTRHQGASQDFNTESYVYDTLGRVEKKTLAFAARTSTFETSFAYDTLGRLKKLTYPKQYAAGVQAPAGKAVEYGFGADGRVNGVTVDSVGLVTEVKYGADGQLTDMSLGAGDAKTNETNQYDPMSGLLANQLVKWANSPQAQALLDLTYEYQLSYSRNPTGYPTDIDRRAYTGQVTRVTGGIQVHNFSYDSLGRVRQLREDMINICYEGCPGEPNRTALWAQTYSYDKFGNRTGTARSVYDGATPVLDGRAGTFTHHEASNRLSSPGFGYDPAGNLTQDGNRIYVYDAANRLSKVKQDGVTLESYAYGASNQRLITYYGDEGVPRKTYYVWNGEAVIAEYAETDASPTSPQWTKNDIYMGSRLLSSQRPGASGGESVQYYHHDRLGTRVVRGPDGMEVQTLPFGTVLNTQSYGTPDNRRLFTSYDRSSATGLDYAVNRFYDPSQGRFTQVDPAGMDAADLTDPQTLNMYAYCGNDPINRVDPDGRFPFGSFFSFVGNFFLGLFQNLRPHQITGSFTYKNLPPISVSFSTNFQTVGAGFGDLQFLLKSPQDSRIQQRVDDCTGFANAVAGMVAGTTWKDRRKVMDQLARTFVGAANSSPLAMLRAQQHRLRTPTRYGSSGFQSQFVDPTELTANQVRHYVGGLIAGFNLGGPTALSIMNGQERRGAPDYVPDTNLNAVSTRHGAELRRLIAPTDLANWILRDVCTP